MAESASGVKAKICGLTTLGAVRAAVEGGASYIGIVFYPPSPRNAIPEVARQVSDYAHSLPGGVKVVGLFVNPTLGELEQAVASYNLDVLQLAGDETPEFSRSATRLRPVIKSIRVPLHHQTAEILPLLAPYAELDNLTLLLDAHKAGMYGGTGHSHNWEVSHAIAERFKLLLAGGLTPENVAEAIRVVKPWGVDVSSGVEKPGAPGVKDCDRIRKFLEQALQTRI